ncbi:MAG: Histidine--tRNA ligase [Parcubacteria group bacterium Gr01-1014_20]|nr:MAG: Histidine--tRNA ligase [Parcubacteria group bacterium Gr01-1014_20]
MPKKTIVKRGGKLRNQEKVFTGPAHVSDILPVDWPWFDRVRTVTEDLANFYGFRVVKTPVLERADFFSTVYDQDPSFFEQQSLTLKAKGSGQLVLRMDGMPAVLRSYFEHGLGKMLQPQKLFYEGEIYRQSEILPGKRMLHQYGFEIVGGSNDPLYDAQIILVMERLLKSFRIKGFTLSVNSMGCRNCHQAYKKQLQAYYRNHEKEICDSCSTDLQKNPLLLMACQKEECEGLKEKAPSFLDKICSSCSRNFRAVLEYLDELEIPYVLDNRVINAWDFYNQILFEFSLESEKGKPLVLARGGRHDFLSEIIGGKVTPAVGGSIFAEAIIEAMKAQDVKLPAKNQKGVFIVHVGELAKKKSLRVVEELRQGGISVTEALGRESIKSQLKMAARLGAQLALLFGQKEVYEESIILRDLRTGLQETVILSKIVSEIQRRLKEKFPVVEG